MDDGGYKDDDKDDTDAEYVCVVTIKMIFCCVACSNVLRRKYDETLSLLFRELKEHFFENDPFFSGRFYGVGDKCLIHGIGIYR